VRIGADIGLVCTKCGHRIMLSRTVTERRFKQFVARPAHRAPFGGSESLEGLTPGPTAE
jgi:hypothetical protein